MKMTIAILSAFILLTQGSALADRAGLEHIVRGPMGYENRYSCSSLTANAKLKLTAEQIVRLRDLDEKYAQLVEPIHIQLRKKGLELKAKWLQTKPDMDRIEVMKGEAEKLQIRLRATLAAQRAEVLRILTPEQQTHLLDEGHGRIFIIPAHVGRR
jgi:Spy/CpxP family protein refolding chaperone